MKKVKMIATAFVMMIALNACKKDKGSDGTNVLEKSYFTIQNATFDGGAFPNASSVNAPAITNVFGNGSILEGGSNPISVTTSSSIKEILVGVEGKNGFYRVNASNLKASPQTFLVYLLFSTEFTENSFAILVSIVDNNGLVSAHETIAVSRVTAGTGKLQISCSWDKPNDLDLHLTEPNLQEIFWDNDKSTNGGELDVDSNPDCSMDYINNENITYSADAKVEKGKYIVRISLFSTCSVTDLTHYIVTARMDGVLLTPTTGTNPYYGTVNAAESYIEGSGERQGKTVMEFNVAATKAAPAEAKLLKFAYPKNVSEEKRALFTK